ncbi:DNA primase small subunit [Eurytemora carolleeae]|uniref:DNA primase small subunit n=1 Tax=Eurytemora carolleeae TaxID=1294199 RepID=UPI000C792B63|nr:DNA primase small subunit [Eurytemora carolleeae]|eukprot:XP_023341373.1 DNA primase small subunit-like [Eurytemora affinis]
MGNFNPEMLQELLPQYYKRLFPYSQFIRWLQYGNIDKNYLSHREFSFTLEGDIYLRYLTFTNQAEFEAALKKKCPIKIDIGAVYNARATEHRRMTNFAPMERELVFDVDLTDYDDVRTCCSGASICPKCWRYMTVAVQIIDSGLREDFGFNNILWVYSGRRGIHCWVCDPQARQLSGKARSAVAEYLQLVSGGDQTTRKVNLKGEMGVHPSVERAVNIIKKNFQKLCLEDQDILGNGRWNKVVDIISDNDLKDDILSSMESCSTSIQRWNVLSGKVRDYVNAKDWKKRKTTKAVLQEIMLQFAYPRLDIAVSKGMNHLLKAPFCVHPKTGRVCVPFDPSKAEQFNPDEVPTISTLLDEIDEFSKDASEAGKKMKDYKKTSLKESINIFEEFLSTMSKNWKGELIAQSDEAMDF